jgi:serine/threonine protein kinase
VPFSDLTVKAELGRGSFSTVVAATYQGRQVAVKMLTPQKNGKRDSETMVRSQFAEFRAEASMLQYALILVAVLPLLIATSFARHQNLVSLIGISMSPLCLVMELMECSLSEYLSDSVPLNWRLRTSIALDVWSLNSSAGY